jgi:glutathione synthase/RimK-type ligase-like ATP-grasp enzyme
VTVAAALAQARCLAAAGEDQPAQRAFLEVLRLEPGNFAALIELGNLALAGGYRSAARTAYAQAVAHHPDNPLARVNLANVLRVDAQCAAAATHYQAALALAPDLHEAHQGLAWILQETDPERAEAHLQAGFTGHALRTQPYRGRGVGVAVLLLVAARGGNLPTQLWLDDRRFAVTAIYPDFYDPAQPLPAHVLVVNAIGDADFCADALARAECLLRTTAAPVINRPERVRVTGRALNARRLGAIAGVIAPRTEARRASELAADPQLRFPLLLRRPGFHTGQHFLRVEAREGLPAALAELGAEELLAIEYLDARAADGMARKYRVMCIDGVLFPLHLAVSRDWKVHYFSAANAESADHRAEERLFLEAMPAVLGTRAMQALTEIFATLGLDYAGVDFGLAADGSVLLFEANATMVVFPPPPDPLWDYRRPAITAVLEAAASLVLRRAP